MAEYLHCTLIPAGTKTEGDAEYLRFSMFLTPVADSIALNTFADWPGKSQLPAFPRHAPPNFTLEITFDDCPLRADEWKFDDEWWGSHRHSLTAEACSELWRSIFESHWVAPVHSPHYGATNPIGAQGSDKASVLPVIDGSSKQMGEALADSAHTTEGISSLNLASRIAGPFLDAHALGVPFKTKNDDKDAPDPDAGYVRQVREALSRLDRSGTSGPSSTAVREQNTAADRVVSEDKSAAEFHETISAMADYPALLRALGLIVDLLVPIASAPGTETFEAGGKITLAGLTLIQSPKTHCWLRGASHARLFTPEPTPPQSGKTTELIEGAYYNPAQLNSVEPDLISALRAALRELDQKDPGRGGPLSLINHGITVFRNDAEFFARKIAETLAGMGRGTGKSWYAEDLVRGFAVDVRLRAPEGGDWGDWFSLNWREVSYAARVFAGQVDGVYEDTHSIVFSVPAKRAAPPIKAGDVLIFGNGSGEEPGVKVQDVLGPNIFFEAGRLAGSGVKKGDDIRILRPAWTPGCDEGAISFAQTEGLQPVSGWLIGRISDANGVQLHVSLHMEDMPEGWPELLGESFDAPLYLLATKSGLMVVADGLAHGDSDLKDFQQRLNQREADPKRAPTPSHPIEDLIRIQSMRRTQFRFGQWVDLTGQPSHTDLTGQPSLSPDMEGTVFVAGEASLRAEPGAAAVAGYFRSVAGDSTLAVVSLERMQVNSRGEESQAPDACVYLEEVDPAALGKMQALPKSNGAQSKILAQWMIARGLPAIRAIKDSASLLDSGNPRLQFVRLEDNVGVFKVPGLIAAAEAVAAEIRLEISSAKLTLLAGNILVGGNIYLLKFRDLKSGTLMLEEIVEETDFNELQIIEIAGDAFSQQATLRTNANINLLVTAETQVSIQEMVPPKPGTPAVQNNGGLTAEDTSSPDAGGPTEERLLGTWAEQGLRVNPGDFCQVRVELVKGSGATPQFRVSKLTVVAHDNVRTALGRFELLKPGDETTFSFTELNSDASERILIDDSTKMIAPPARPGGKWRALAAPPPGALVKLFRRPSNGLNSGVLAADRIEVLSDLTGVVANAGEITCLARAGQLGQCMIKMRVAGLEDPVEIGITRASFPDLENILPLLGSGRVDFRLVNNPQKTPGETAVQFSLMTVAALQKKEGKVLAIFPDFKSLRVQPPRKDDLSPGMDGRLRNVTITWRAGQELPGVEPREALPVRVIGQIAKASPGGKWVEFQVLWAPPEEPGITTGQTVRLFLDDLDDNLKKLLSSLVDSRLPLEFEADVGVLIPKKSDSDALHPCEWELAPWPDKFESQWTISKEPPIQGAMGRVSLISNEEGTEAAGRTRLVRFVPGENLDGVPSMKAPPPLLPDQFIVDDSLFHWFGSSAVVKPAGDAAIPSAPERDNQSRPAIRGVRVKQTVPAETLPPLRVGYGYEFALRAVYLAGTDPGESTPPPAARLCFSALADFWPINRFLRLDSMGPPRVGWLLNPNGLRELSPEATGVLPIGNGEKLLDHRASWGTVSDLFLYSDTRLPLAEGEIHHQEFEQRVRDYCSRGPQLLIRPPEITVQQAELSGIFENWMRWHSTSQNPEEIYRNVIAPRDRVEYDWRLEAEDLSDPIKLLEMILIQTDDCSAFLRGQLSIGILQAPGAVRAKEVKNRAEQIRTTARELAEELNKILAGKSVRLEVYCPDTPKLTETKQALDQPGFDRMLLNRMLLQDAYPGLIRKRQFSTPGLLLPRLPDPDAAGLVLAVNGKALGPSPDFVSGGWNQNWPVGRDLTLLLSPSDLEVSPKAQQHSEGVLEVLVPLNSDLRLELRARPTAEALRNHAIYQWLKARKTEKSEAGKVQDAMKKVEQGLHPSVSSSMALRIRHLYHSSFHGADAEKHGIKTTGAGRYLGERRGRLRV